MKNTQNKIGLSLISRSQVPGYCGFVPGYKSQNIYGVTYAKIAQESLDRTKTALNLPPELHYLTINVGNSHRIKDNVEKGQTPESHFWHNSHNITLLQTKKQNFIKEKQSHKEACKQLPRQTEMTLEEAYRHF